MNNSIKVIVAGGRDFNNYSLLRQKMDSLLANRLPAVEIVCGKARGADTLGETYAKERGLQIKYFPAEWDKYGRSAGYRRNNQMAEYADAVVAFWDGKSRGTEHMINLAKEKGLAIRIVNY